MEQLEFWETESTNALREALALLREARAFLDGEERFTKGAWARDKNDKPVPAESSRARKWCIAGAVLAAQSRVHGTAPLSGRDEAGQPTREVGPKRVDVALRLLALPAIRVFAVVYFDVLEREVKAAAEAEQAGARVAAASEIAQVVNDRERIRWVHVDVVLKRAIERTEAELRERRQQKRRDG
jgi:hypothetical protein